MNDQSPELPAELNDATLSEVIGQPVRVLAAESVGTGQMAACFRVQLLPEAALPETLVVKLPAGGPESRAMVAGAYRSEVRFYTELAPSLDVQVPKVYGATVPGDDGDFILVLEDSSPRQQGDQILGCTPEQAKAAAVNLAGLHGPRWCDPTLKEADWPAASTTEDIELLDAIYESTAQAFFEAVGDMISSEDRETISQIGEVIAHWSLARGERFAPLHGDYRLDNLMFTPDAPKDVQALDWQTLSLGLPARDLSYLLGTGLSIRHRRDVESEVVTAYHQRLLGYGITDYSNDQCWDDYVFGMIQGPMVSIFGCAYGTKTERGNRMFAAMVERSCAAIRELGTLDLL